jgi:hypothetical protein
MGILADSPEEDIRAIREIAKWCAEAYNVYQQENLLRVPFYHVEVNEDVIPVISELGGRVVENCDKPDFLVRTAIVVVLANYLPPFQLSREGRVVTDIDERKDFFAKLATAFVYATFAFFTPESEAGRYSLKFRDDGQRYRFLLSLRLMDVGEVVVWDRESRRNPSAFRAKEAKCMKTLFKDAVNVTEFLCGAVQFVPRAEYEQLDNLWG